MEPGGDEAFAEISALNNFKAKIVSDLEVDMVRVTANDLTAEMLIRHDFERVLYRRGQNTIGYTRLARFVQHAHETYEAPDDLDDNASLLSYFLECPVEHDHNMTFRVVGLALLDNATLQEAANLLHRSHGQMTFRRFYSDQKVIFE